MERELSLRQFQAKSQKQFSNVFQAFSHFLLKVIVNSTEKFGQGVESTFLITCL